MIPDYPWFGPRHGMGWGWAPITWEGKLLTFAALVACAILVLLGHHGRITTRQTLFWILGIVAGALAIAAFTGTAPG